MTDELRQRLGHDRQALHAYELEFMHPTKRELMKLTAPLAQDLVGLWGQALDEAAFASAWAC
jgi:hypothetical protein